VQRLHLAGLDEAGDVVVGVEALARLLDPLADADRDRNAFVAVVGRGRGVLLMGVGRKLLGREC